MKFKCKICGQQIDNPYICPYCGSGSDHIILIDEDEEEELKEEVTEEKLDETYEDESSYETIIYLSKLGFSNSLLYKSIILKQFSVCLLYACILLT